jgi:hypothetical protein
MEVKAHQERMEALIPIFPLLLGQADFMAHTAAALQVYQAGGDIEEEQYEQMCLAFNNIVRAAVVSSVSTAVAMGVLEINKSVTTDEEC